MTALLKPYLLRGLLLVLAMPALSGCHKSSDSDDDDTVTVQAQYVVAATAAPDFSSGAHSLVSAEPPRAASNNLDASGSDLLVKAHGEHFYRIERFGADMIRKYHAQAPATPIWSFSTDDPGASFSNVHDLVFAKHNKAYLIRYGAATAWITDPSTDSEASFKTGELDLSAYADADGIPEMEAAVIVGNRLFIAMQRFENFTSLGTAYVAVFNIKTDTEIDTGKDTVNFLKGIPLPVKNPQDMVYDPHSGLIYLLGGGKLACGFCMPATPAEYSGGIISIDPSSFETQLLVDDGDDASHPYGNLSALAIVNAGQGYFIGYNDFADTSLYRFDPSTGVVQAFPVAGLANQDLTSLGMDNEAFLWVGRGDLNNPALVVLDTTTDLVEQVVGTGLNPQNLAFGAVPVTAAP